MKMSYKSSIITAFGLLLPVFVWAMPVMPHQFYGTVDFENGPAPDGLLVEVKIDNVVVGNTVTSNGRYGDSVFYVEDPDGNRNGERVGFFVSGIDSGETAIFSNGASTYRPLTVPGTIGNIIKDEGEIIENEEIVVTSQSFTNIQLGNNLNINISSVVNTNATIERIEKLSSGNVAVFSGKNFLNAYEIKISGENLNITVTMTYDDSGIDEDTIAPYWFNGTIWVEVTDSVYVNKDDNTIRFTIPSGQTVYAVFGSEPEPEPTPPTDTGTTGGGGPTTPPTYKTGDTNKDNKVDKYDFALMMAAWGKTGTNLSDLNNDNKVDKYDFALLMLNWSTV